MRRDFKLIRPFIFVLVLTILIAGIVHAETRTTPAEGVKVLFGEVSGVNCASGEIKIKGRTGEETLYVVKDTEFKVAKACEDIAIGGRALVHYKEADGKKIIETIKYRQMKKAAKGEREKGNRSNLFMGFVRDADCEKGIITLEYMDDRSKAETFYVSKDTVYDPARGIKSCGDIKKGVVVTLSYDEKGDKKVVRKIKAMDKGGRK